MLKKFRKNVKAVGATGAVTAFIAAVIIIIAGVYMVPVIAHEVDNVIYQNSSAWNFTGASGAASLMGLIPFVFIAALLVAVVAITFAFASKSK